MQTLSYTIIKVNK